jgi:GDPmannose 4,6-dehydratase
MVFFAGKKMKALIFGINGQDGFYLCSLLQQKKIDVIGISRSKTAWLYGDVGDFKLVSELIKKGTAGLCFSPGSQFYHQP